MSKCGQVWSTPMPDTGLTPYIVALIRHPDIMNACPIKAASRFNIRVDHAREYLNRERERRHMPVIQPDLFGEAA